MANFDGDIKLGVSVETQSAEQSLNSLKKTVHSTFAGTSTSSMDKNLQNVNKQVEQTRKEFQKVQAEIQKTEDKMRELKTRYDVLQEKGLSRATKTNTKEYDGKYYTQADYAKIKLLDTQLENVGARLDELNAKSSQLGANLSQSLSQANVSETSSKVEEVSNSAERATKSTGGLKNAFSAVISKGKKFVSSILSGLKNVTVSIGRLAKNITTKLGSALTAPFRSIGNSITNIFKKISTSIRRVFVFSVITAALREVRSAISNLISSDEKLKSSLTQIRSNLWTAFAPIYTKALPAIQSLMNALSKATAYVASFFSALMGNSVSQSYKEATDLYDKANAKDLEKQRIDKEIDAVQKKIKALEKEEKAYKKKKEAEEKANKKSVLSFDELNRLETPDKEDEILQSYEDQTDALQEQLELLQDQKDALDDIKDSSEALTYPVQAEDLYSKMKSVVDKIKKAWEDADFTEIGKSLKDNIIDALDNIDWGKIKSNAYKIGKSIATFINGAFTPDFGAKIGTALAEAVNTAVEALGGFVENLNAIELGKTLSDFVVNSIQKINWSRVKSVAGTAGKKIAEFINNAITPRSFGALGTALAEGINTAIEFAYEFLTTIDPINLGKSLAAFFNDAIKKIDWIKLGKSIFAGINNAILFMIEFLRETDWEAVGRAIAEMIENIDWLELLKNVGTLIIEAIKAAIKLAAGMLGIDIDDDTATFIAEAIGVGALIGVFTKLISHIKDKLLPTFQEKDDALDRQTRKTAEEATAVNLLENSYEGATRSAFSFVPALNGVLTAGMGLIPVIQELFQSHEQLNPAIDATTNGIYSLAEGEAALIPAMEQSGQAISGTIPQYDAHTNAVSVARQCVSDFVQNVISSMPLFGTSIMSAFSNANSNITSFATGTKESLGSWGEVVFSVFDAVIQKIPAGMYDMLYNMWENINSFVSQTPQSFLGWAQGIVSVFNNLGESLSSWFSSMWDSFCSFMAGIGESVSSFFVDNWQPIAIGAGIALVAAGAIALAPATGGGSLAVLPALANGAVLEPNNPFLAMVGDQKSGVNIEAPLSTIQKGVADVMNPALSALTDVLVKVLNVLSALTSGSAFNSGGDSLNLRTAVENLSANIRGVGNQLYSIGTASGLNIPHLASGSVIPPNKEFLAVLGDQKSGTNIEAPLDTIKQGLAEVMAESGVGGDLNITCDKSFSQLVRLMNIEIKKERTRAGSSLVMGGNKA